MISGFSKKLMACAMSVALCVAAGSAMAADVIKIKIAYGNNVGEPQ